MNQEEKLLGSDSELLIGLHSGIFDCNQEYNYPFNIGAIAQYNYTPNVLKNWFVGSELGVFFTQNGEDGNLREMGAIIGHFSIYPGIAIDLNKKEFPEEENFSDNMRSNKLKFAAGITVGLPVKTYSSGSTYDPSNADSGFGFTGMVSYQMPNKLNIFASATRVGADMDGFGYDPVSGDSTPGNEGKVSYWYKIGIAYNVLGK